MLVLFGYFVSGWSLLTMKHLQPVEIYSQSVRMFSEESGPGHILRHLFADVKLPFLSVGFYLLILTRTFRSKFFYNGQKGKTTISDSHTNPNE